MNNTIESNIVDRISDVLNKTGIYYRIFSRQKSTDSIKRKLNAKKDEYLKLGKKMQDFVGVRIIFYFKDDIYTFLEILRSWPSYDSANESNSICELSEIETKIKDSEIKQLCKLLPLTDKIFMPERLNIVMKMDGYETDLFNDIMSPITDFDSNMIDNTYEIQLRTVLSEGWHEVEHDLRYKTQHEKWWNNCQEESRLLNGIYASLVSSEAQLASIVEEIAYKAFHKQEWDTMIRFHYRIRMQEDKLSANLLNYLNENYKTAKSIYRADRKKLIQVLNKINVKIDITSDLIVFIINRIEIQDDVITNMESRPVKQILGKAISCV